MKILYFDCFSGISGDMAIGALLDLGIDRELFLKELSGLDLKGYRIEINTKTMNGIRGTDVNVVLTDEEGGRGQDCMYDHEHGHRHDHSHEYDHGHDHSHDHGHNPAHEHDQDHGHDHSHEHDHAHEHDHDHGHSHEQGHTHGHGERSLADIEQLLDRSSLKESVKAFSKKVFREIAEAEAKVHGKSIQEVHFHEVGAVDSIVDIAGTAICLELLGADRVYSSVLHDGKGTIRCRHGIIPVPVPAVMEMLAGSGIPLVSGDADTELVTPTGMGIIKCLSSGFGNMPPMTVEKTGYGLGKRDTGRLNALRAVLGNSIEDGYFTGTVPMDRAVHEKEQGGGDEVAVLETNIDDSSAEILGYTMGRLLDAGALDAFYTPVFMKKNRPAYMLTVLAAPEKEGLMAEIIMAETSTLGIRTRYMKRYCMERKVVDVTTKYGPARVKTAAYGEIRKASPEYEDCRKIAESTGIPLAKAYAEVMAEAAKQYGI